MTLNMFNQVMLQTFYYGLVMVITLFFCGAFMRGFLVTYFRVRTSFGKYVIVKIRSPLRDYFAKGWVDEGFLIYKHNKEIIRLNIPQTISPFYKCLAVVWVDVDDEKHAISSCDYSAVTGYDAVKNNNLHTRALMRPSISTGQEKLILGGIVVLGVAVLILGYFAYNNYAMLQELQTLPSVVQSLKGTVVGGGAF